MDTLIHSPDGKLESVDPYRKVGTRGSLSFSTCKWIIVEESLKQQEIFDGGAYKGDEYVCMTLLNGDNPNLRNPVAKGSIYRRDQVDIIEPGNSNYFKVKGFDD